MVTENIATWTEIPSPRKVGLWSKRDEHSEPMRRPRPMSTTPTLQLKICVPCLEGQVLSLSGVWRTPFCAVIKNHRHLHVEPPGRLLSRIWLQRHQRCADSGVGELATSLARTKRGSRDPFRAQGFSVIPGRQGSITKTLFSTSRTSLIQSLGQGCFVVLLA